MDKTKALVAQVFTFRGHNLQVIMHNGKPAFIGKEVCDALEIKNHRDAISVLPDHQKDDVGISDAIGRIQNTKIVYEGGMYRLAFRSTKPEAQEFTDLVTDEILPSIRKTGSYSVAVPQQLHLPLEDIKDLKTIVGTLLEEVAQLRAVIKPNPQLISKQKESARSRVFRYFYKLEKKTKEPVTAREISRRSPKIPVAVTIAYLQEAVEQGILEPIETPHTTKYRSIKQ